jgi:hypothetical protein
VIEAVRGEKEEEFVAKNRAADAESELTTQVGGLERLNGVGDGAAGGLNRVGDVGILCSPCTIAVVIVALTVQGVRSALGDGVDDATGGAAVFNGVVLGIDLELLHSGLNGGVSGAGASALFREVGLVVVGAVDCDVVEQRALAAEAQQAVAVRVVHDAGGEQREGRPAVIVLGQIVERDLVYHAGKIGSRRIDERRTGRHFDGLRGAADTQACFDVCQGSDLDCNVFRVVEAESRRFDFDFVNTRLEVDDAEVAGGVGDRLLLSIGAQISHGNRSVGYNCAGAIENVAAHSAIDGRLCPGYRYACKQNEEGR